MSSFVTKFQQYRDEVSNQLSKNFNSDEFTCPCCGRSEMELAFINKLQYARDVADIPFVISEGGGFRCEKYNTANSHVSNSTHLIGQAADIKAVDNRERGLILASLYRAGFTRIGIGRTFIHADSDTTKDQCVAWLY